MNTNYNPVNLYLTGFKENANKINMNVLMTDNSFDENSKRVNTNTSQENNSSIRNSKIQ